LKNINNLPIRLRILCYDTPIADSEHIIADVSETSKESVELMIPQNTKCLRCVIYIAFGTTITSGTVFLFNDVDLSYIIESQTGDYLYYGDSPINIRPKSLNYYNKKKILSKNYYPSANIDYRAQQGMALWGNYLFCFEGNDGTYMAKCQIFEFNSLNDNSDPICSMSIDSKHANSAEFTHTYYDSNDEFPLLLVSYFYPGNKAGLFRIIRDGNNFTATLIKEIILDGSKFEIAIPYGGTFVVNYTTNILYVFIPQERWNDYLYKPILAYSFQLPDLLETNTDITLTESDIVNSYQIPWFVVQSAIFINGLLYIPTQLSPSSPFMGYTGRLMLVVDPNGFVVKNIVPLNNGLEEEGIVVSGDDIYISFRWNSATEGNTVFEIEKYSFNQ
jgi:hypothetical protein